jgi:hypothetical protein
MLWRRGKPANSASVAYEYHGTCSYAANQHSRSCIAYKYYQDCRFYYDGDTETYEYGGVATDLHKYPKTH